MKKYLIILCLFALFSCSKESLESSLNNEQGITLFRSCTTIEPDFDVSPTGRVSYKGTYWFPGQTIRIKFLNGDAYLQSKVKQYANQWLQHSNLKYEWVASGDAAIKISFKWNGDQGSWSKIGTGCYNAAQNSPSMNFGWFDSSTSEEEFSRVVIHEFGHALGFAHEHQNPISPIQWNTAAVYNYYELAGWDKEEVDYNILNKFSTSTVDYTNFDEKSIMLYSFPSFLTLNGYSSAWNTVLSDEDKVSATTLYPFPTSIITDRLVSGQSLKAGEFLISKNYWYTLTLNKNGNLELAERGKVIWQTNRIGTGGIGDIAHVDMQTDGNFATYFGGTKALWSTETTGKTGSVGSYITLNNLGGLEVIDRRGWVVWSIRDGKINSPFIY
jgi:hypothetical protein